MTTHDKENHDENQEDLSNGNNEPGARKLLYQVLLDEYEKLDILDAQAIKDITDKEKELKQTLKIQPDKALKNLNQEELLQQEELNVEMRGQLIKLIRDKVYEAKKKERDSSKEENKEPWRRLFESTTAVCFSGGGIRSATFGLGILEGLAKQKLLGKFTYLSSVSGGGYISSWFSAWLYREGNIQKVQAALGRDEKYKYLFGLKSFSFAVDEKLPLYINDKRLSELVDKVENLKDDLTKLVDPKKNSDYGFWKENVIMTDELIELLGNTSLPSVSDIRENPAVKNKLRTFVQSLCLIFNNYLDPVSESATSKTQQPHRPASKLDEVKEVKRKFDLLKEKLKDHVKRPDESGQTEPIEITHLRTYSNFMSPQVGLFSTDTWTLIAVYIRNLLLNWTVFIPLIAAFLMVPKLFVSFLSINLTSQGNAVHILSWLPKLIISFLNIPYQGDETSLGWFTAIFLLWLISIMAGAIGARNINAMRPSLKTYSWVDQSYQIDDIGIEISVERKVFSSVVLPLLIMGFAITIYGFWTNGSTLSPLTYEIIKDKEGAGIQNIKLLGFMGFVAFLFLCGYAWAWIYMFNSYRNKSVKDPNFGKKSLWEKFKVVYRVYLSEIVASIASSIVGGGLLYLTVYKVPYYIFGVDKADLYAAKIYACFGAPLFLLVYMLSSTTFTGFAVKFTNDMDREWTSRLYATILKIMVGWSLLSSAVIFGPELLTFNFILPDWTGCKDCSGLNWVIKTGLTAIGGISGLITLVLGFSSGSSAKDGEKPKSPLSFLLWFAPAVAAPLFVVFLLILISHLTNLLTENITLFAGYNRITWFIILAGIGIVMGFFININKFSIHSIYRERLIRAYLGASRTKERLKTANSFTGLDSENDNIDMKDLDQKPLHVVNMTLNLVKTSNLRWQNRKAESFTATAYHCGSSNMGNGAGNFRSSEYYGFNSQNQSPISLGTVAAISGAAASPNMGYYTMSTAVSALMVLFNIRLGWWLGNPGKRGDTTYNLSAPFWSPRVFFNEALGLTDDEHEYVYLADGGQFENLGLYEMIQRRCQTILVCDGGADPEFTFFDLGSAIHKIRVDMGIPIEFVEGKDPKIGRYCALARIRYSAVDDISEADDGILIYIKPTLNGKEAADIVNYSSANPDFPHETTADQFYSETQFESYRSLGYQMIDTICRNSKPINNWTDFAESVKYYLEHSTTPTITPQDRLTVSRWVKIVEALFR